MDLPCPICTFVGSRVALENHVKKAHLKWFPYECTYCEHIDVSHQQQEVHRLDKHPDKQAKVIYCGNDLIEKQLVEMMDVAGKKAAGDANVPVTSVVDASRAVNHHIPADTKTQLKPEPNVTPLPTTNPLPKTSTKRKAKSINAIRNSSNSPPLPVCNGSESADSSLPPAYVNGCESVEGTVSILNAISAVESFTPSAAFTPSHATTLSPSICRFCHFVYPSIGGHQFYVMEEKLEHMQVHMDADFKHIVPMIDTHDRLNRLGAVCFDGFDLDSPVQEGPVDIKPVIIHNGVVPGNGLADNGVSSMNDNPKSVGSTKLEEDSYRSSLTPGFDRDGSDSMSETMDASMMDDEAKEMKNNPEWMPNHRSRKLKMTLCRLCNESFNTAKMSHHVWQHHFHTKIYQCAECEYATAQGRSNVYMHWKKHHQGQPMINDRRNEFIKEYKVIYEQCYGTLPRNQNGVIRVRQMKRDSTGAICHKDNFCHACQTNVIQNAYAHVWMKHVGEKGFVCDLCPYKAFARDQAVDHWLRNHDGEARINDVRDDFRDLFRQAWTLCFPEKHVA